TDTHTHTNIHTQTHTYTHKHTHTHQSTRGTGCWQQPAGSRGPRPTQATKPWGSTARGRQRDMANTHTHTVGPQTKTTPRPAG
ncbi:hypothetical protein LDENG_00016290, partial [Lucifuga dentata]